jgi:hypothetical protein
MDPTCLTANDGFDRLQRLLLSLKPGDDLTTTEAARISGLREPVCLAVFEGLERAGLMCHATGDRFVRKALELSGV